MKILTLVLIAYFSGSLPTGYLIAKFLKGIDIRKHGSGNPGATNVFRIVGKLPGIITLLIDALKGYLPVVITAKYLFPNEPGFWLLAGLCAIAGHMWTIFLNFHGGKGVATGAGVFIALLPLPTGLAVLVFAIVLAITRYVSLGSMISAFSLPIFAALFNAPIAFTTFAAIAGAAIIYKHKSNMINLLNGKEDKIIFSKKAEQGKTNDE